MSLPRKKIASQWTPLGNDILQMVHLLVAEHQAFVYNHTIIIDFPNLQWESGMRIFLLKDVEGTPENFPENLFCSSRKLLCESSRRIALLEVTVTHYSAYIISIRKVKYAMRPERRFPTAGFEACAGAIFHLRTGRSEIRDMLCDLRTHLRSQQKVPNRGSDI